MRQHRLWNEIAEDENYGRKWKAQGKSDEELDDLIATEVHLRFIGACVSDAALRVISLCCVYICIAGSWSSHRTPRTFRFFLRDCLRI